MTITTDDLLKQMNDDCRCAADARVATQKYRKRLYQPFETLLLCGGSALCYPLESA